MRKKGWTRLSGRLLKPLSDLPAAADKLKILKTVYWYDELSGRTGKGTAYALERLIEPEAFGRSGDNTHYHRNKWSRYEDGKHAPQKKLRDQADRIVPGSGAAFDHVLWSDALQMKQPLGDRTDSLLKSLGPDIAQVVFVANVPGATRSHLRRPVDGRLLRKLENRAGIDSLACLTILLREAREQDEPKRTMDIGMSLFWVLLMFCTTGTTARIRHVLFDLYRSEIFPLAATEHERFDLDEYPLVRASDLLNRSVLEAEDRGLIGPSWADTVEFMLRLIRGQLGLNLRVALLPKFVRIRPDEQPVAA